jgi:hypothetical protein
VVRVLIVALLAIAGAELATRFVFGEFQYTARVTAAVSDLDVRQLPAMGDRAARVATFTAAYVYDGRHYSARMEERLYDWRYESMMDGPVPAMLATAQRTGSGVTIALDPLHPGRPTLVADLRMPRGVAYLVAVTLALFSLLVASSSRVGTAPVEP